MKGVWDKKGETLISAGVTIVSNIIIQPDKELPYLKRSLYGNLPQETNQMAEFGCAPMILALQKVIDYRIFENPYVVKFGAEGYISTTLPSIN